MKKFFAIIILFILSSEIASAKNYNIGDLVSGVFEPGKRLKINLNPGNWQVVYKSSDLIYGITARAIGIVRVENNEIVEIIEVEYIQTGGQWQSTVGGIVIEIFYKSPYGGCYERPDNYMIAFFRKGNSHNCLIVGHFDLPKRLTNPDDPELRGEAAQYNQWIKSSGVKIPKIVLVTQHLYFSQMTGGNFYNVSYFINPKSLNSPKSNFFTTDSSEYHKYNIEKYPKHKEIMDKWVSISANRHKIFEKNIKAKQNHYLNLNQYIDTSINENTDTSIVEQIKDLKELLDAGAITKEEFEKVKKKLLY